MKIGNYHKGPIELLSAKIKRSTVSTQRSTRVSTQPRGSDVASGQGTLRNGDNIPYKQKNTY